MKRWYYDTYSVERRFGLTVLLIATLYCAALVAFFRALGTYWFPKDLFFVGGLIASTAVAQAALQNTRPQRSSLVVGALYVVVWAYMHEAMPTPSVTRVWSLAMVVVLYALVGAVLGYCAGAVSASMFLLSDLLHAFWMGRRGKEQDTGDGSPFDESAPGGAQGRQEGPGSGD